MINNREGKMLYKRLNTKIVKYLRKYYKVIDKDKINELRNDIFIKLYDDKVNFPEDKNEVSKYIYVTCKNHMLNYKRNIKKNSFIEYTDDESIIDEFITDDTNNIENDYIFLDYLNYELSKMDNTKRDILNYKNMGYNLNEISKIINLPKTNVYRIFDKIKKEQHDNL